MQDVSPTGNISSDHNPSIAAEEFISIKEEDIPAMHSHDLTDISVFRQLYLMGKILGESMLLKTILSKCLCLEVIWGS